MLTLVYGNSGIPVTLTVVVKQFYFMCMFVCFVKSSNSSRAMEYVMLCAVI